MHMSNVRWAASSCVVYRECVFVCVCERERGKELSCRSSVTNTGFNAVLGLLMLLTSS